MITAFGFTRHDGTPVFVSADRIVMWYSFEEREPNTTITHKLVRIIVATGGEPISLDVKETMDEINKALSGAVHNEG